MTVFTIPIGLTEFQKDLIEILLSIHHQPLLKELSLTDGNNEETISEPVKEEPTITPIHYPTFTPRQMMYLLDTHVRAVANHPGLLVDHYMPRQFLRMEPKQRLINPSNKFDILQQLLYKLTTYKSENGPLSITLVAHSMKELDLIEGLVLGQNFNLKRLSGTTLYDEKNVFPHDGNSPSTSASISPSTTNIGLNERSNNHVTNSTASSTANLVGNSSSSNSSSSTTTTSEPDHVTSNMNKYTGYSKDDYHYNNKKRKLNKIKDITNHHNIQLQQRTCNKNKNWLFLTTTKHLIHDEELLHRYNTNLIIAFDPLIDDNMPCLTLPTTSTITQSTTTKTHPKQRSKKKNVTLPQSFPRQIPIIKLLVKDSPDHYIIDNDLVNEQDPKKEYINIKDSLVHFLLNRENINDNSDSINFNEIITKALKSVNDPTLESTSLLMTKTNSNKMTKEELLPFFKPHFMQKYDETTSLNISLYPFNLKNYQSELMQKTLTRLHEITQKFESNDNILVTKRIEENNRQNQLDDLKVNIGINFKNFQEKEKLQLESDKTLERITTENEKVKTIYNKLKRKCDEMDELVNELKNNENVKEKINKFAEKVTTLQDKLDKLLKLNKDRTTVEDKLRSQYQLDSTTAANKSLEFKNWEKSKQFLEKRKQDPQWAELACMSAVSNQTDLEKQLKQYKESNQFIKKFIDKMTEVNLSRQVSKGKNGSTTRGKSSSHKNKKSSHSPYETGNNSSSTSPSTPSSSASSSIIASSSISAEISTKNAITGSRLRSTRSTSPNYT